MIFKFVVARNEVKLKFLQTHKLSIAKHASSYKFKNISLISLTFYNSPSERIIGKSATKSYMKIITKENFSLEAAKAESEEISRHRPAKWIYYGQKMYRRKVTFKNINLRQQER